MVDQDQQDKELDQEHEIAPVTSHVAVDTASKQHHGLGLWPPPSDDDKDPLRWPQHVKILALIVTAFFNFVANFAASGPSVATTVFQEEFQKTENEVNSLLTYNFLLIGLGNMFWVPLSVKFGKRAIMLISMAILFAILIWTAKVKTFDQLLAARCLSALAAAAGESIVPGIVSDMFFLHERGAMLSVYVMLIASGTAIGPLVAGFVVADSPGTWRDFMWVSAALAGFSLVTLFLFYPESSYLRPTIETGPPPPAPPTSTIAHATSTIAHASVKEEEGGGTGSSYGVEHHPPPSGLPAAAAAADGNSVPVPVVSSVSTVPFSYPRDVWATFFRIDSRLNTVKVFLEPFLFLLSAPVLWTVYLYGAALAAQIALIFALPSFLIPAPYLFPSSYVGLLQIGAVIGYTIACFGGGYVCDVITARLIIRNRGVFHPEQRLVSLLPGCLVLPAGCILIAFACAHELNWGAIAVGLAMLSFGTVYAPNIAMTYLLDSYLEFSQRILVVVNVIKNLVAFCFVFVAVDWVNSQGWIQVYMIMFMVVSLSLLLAIPLYFFGRRARKIFDKWVLSRKLIVL